MKTIEYLWLDEYSITQEAFDALFGSLPQLRKPKYMPLEEGSGQP